MMTAAIAVKAGETIMSDANLAAERGFRFTGWHMLATVCTFFAVVIAVDVGMATMAYRTFSGEVAKDPYEAGLAYNRTLAQRRAEAALGWSASIEDTRGVLRLHVTDRAGRPVIGLTVVAKLERPATEAGSVNVVFAPSAPGIYDGQAAGLAGAWDVSARATDKAGHLFEAQRRVVWP
jgi:nitrogen fixation protein FixH